MVCTVKKLNELYLKYGKITIIELINILGGLKNA